jgi:hypothetical protein
VDPEEASCGPSPAHAQTGGHALIRSKPATAYHEQVSQTFTDKSSQTFYQAYQAGVCGSGVLWKVVCHSHPSWLAWPALLKDSASASTPGTTLAPSFRTETCPTCLVTCLQEIRAHVCHVPRAGRQPSVCVGRIHFVHLRHTLCISIHAFSVSMHSRLPAGVIAGAWIRPTHGSNRQHAVQDWTALLAAHGNIKHRRPDADSHPHCL